MPAYTNARQHIPELFLEIMKVEAVRRGLYARAIAENVAAGDSPPGQDEWRQMKGMRVIKQDFMRAAEQALRWNTDKGSVS